MKHQSCWAGLVMVCLRFFACFAIFLSGQALAQSSGAGDTQPAPPAIAVPDGGQVNADNNAEEQARLQKMRDAVAKAKTDLKKSTLLKYLIALVSGLIAVAVFLYRRRHLLTLSKTLGVVTAVALSAALLFLANTLADSATQGVICATAELKTGSKATIYDDGCREAREASANLIGLSAAYRASFMGDDTTIAIDVGTLNGVNYSSVIIASLLVFLLAYFPVKRFFVRV